MDSFQFDMPKNQSNVIKVIGVGGGGSNAINHMFSQGINGVDFVICNTDSQALDSSPVPNKIQLGVTLTEGLGAGANPEIGEQSAVESMEDIKAMLTTNTKMLFITAGMGGGTGTGAAPIIAKMAKDLNILTVGIVTIPFEFEGKMRNQQAHIGVERLRDNVDSLIVINNNKLRDVYGNLGFKAGFSKADDILAVAAKGISEIITVTGYVNTDFRDVQTVMKDGGTAIMGSGTAEGENRAIDAVTKALASPLLNDNEIKGANYILLNITSGTEEITMDEIGDITDFIQDEAGLTADVIWGNCTDESLGEKVSVTVIATGFGANSTDSFKLGEKPEKVIMTLDADVPTSITTALNDDVVGTTEVTSEDEEPTLKTAVKEQPTLNFETENPIVEKKVEKPAAERVVFNLESEDEDVEAKTDEATWNWGANTTTEEEVEATVNEEEITFVDKEVKDDFVAESIEEEIIEEPIAEETKTVVWNLDDSSTEDDGVDAESIEEITFTKKQNNIDNSADEGPVYTNRLPDEEQMKRSQERIMKIKELGMRMKTPSGINDLENEPAYKRRKINLDEVAHSSENPISRFTLSNDGEGKPKLNDDNSFLHDNVD